jgi:hypothetical protein
MPMDQNVTFRPVAVDGRWQVEVHWPDGKRQRLSGYVSEDEAQSWIRYYSAQWLAIAVPCSKPQTESHELAPVSTGQLA